MHNIYLQKIKLLNYRNFKQLDVSVDNGPIIIIGENGTGKTNILESISLFSPGRGLRSAKLADLLPIDVDDCSAYALLQSKIGPAEILVKLKRHANKRFTEFNGVTIANNELSNFSSMIWLTPQMDGIFSGSSSDRRKFFDRIVYNFIPAHAALVTNYEYYLYERNKILSQYQLNENFLTIIEEKLAELSIKIASNRVKILQYIQQAIDDFDNDFPKALLAINGVIEDKIAKDHHIDIGFIKDKYLLTRSYDTISNRTSFGVHKSDFTVTHREKKLLAKFCSTGEQKALLVALIIAQINYSIKEKIATPILLLDEIFVHLDDNRRKYLIDYFLAVPLQLWITATDLHGIESLTEKAQLIKL